MIALAIVLAGGWHNSFRHALADLRFGWQSRQASGDIVVIAIDASSIDRIGVWPWPRLLHAELIRQLQKEHQPLAEIRAQLEGLRDQDVRRLLSRPSKRPTSAVDYVRSVLGGSSHELSSSRTFASPGPAVRLSTPVKSQWERISLAPDVELHVRRPLTREANRRVEKLLDLARQILKEEE